MDVTIDIITPIKNELTLEERMNGEFKSLRKRITKLEQLVLSAHTDNGEIKSKPKDKKKG